MQGQGLGSFSKIGGVSVCFGINSNTGDVQRLTGADYAPRNGPAIGDQNLSQQAAPPTRLTLLKGQLVAS